MTSGRTQDAGGELREVPIAWEALEDAFENNAPEVNSYLNLDTGDVIRLVDGIAEPGVQARVSSDPAYLRVDPVSSREQYRWMERFVASVEDKALRDRLVLAIDGKGAFRRFKDVLLSYPVERDRWFSYRATLLHIYINSWLRTKDIALGENPPWGSPDQPTEPDVPLEKPVGEVHSGNIKLQPHGRGGAEVFLVTTPQCEMVHCRASHWVRFIGWS